MRGPGGYGRYDDDPNHIGCPYAKSDMTPCVARDGHIAQTTNHRDHQGEALTQVCVGCGHIPADLLRDLVREVTEPVTT